MKLEELYLSSPTWLQNLLVSSYGYLLRRRRFGPGYRAVHQQLLENEYMSEAQLRDLQQNRLTSIVTHAFQHVPHYRELAVKTRIRPSDVTLDTLHQALPILEKEQVRAEPRRFVSELNSHSTLKINTSGTTGSPMVVVCTLSSLRTNYAFFARFLGWHGITLRTRSATFAGRTIASPHQKNPPFWRHNPAFNNIQFSSYHLSPGNLGAYVSKLAEWSPKLIDTYPSSGATLANYINQIGATGRINPRVVVTSSESLLDHQRAAMEQAFGCPVRDQYGSAEMVSFIAECDYGTLHIAPEYGFVELIAASDDNADIGSEIIATGFINPAMPLLRYRTGDRVIASNVGCPCGRSFPAIKQIFGRTDDIIMTPEGNQIGRLDPVFKGANGIVECQIYQERLDVVKLNAVLAPGFGEEALEPVVRQLRHRLPSSMSVVVRLLPSLPRSANGKLRAVVSVIRQANDEKLNGDDRPGIPTRTRKYGL